MPSQPLPKAIIFDIGGVVVHSPLEGIRSAEIKLSLPKNYLNVAIQDAGAGGAFQRLERGEVEMEPFFQQFGSELSGLAGVNGYKAYLNKLKKTGVDTSEDERKLADLVRKGGIKVDGKDLFIRMMKESIHLNETVVRALQILKGKFKLAALTNNFHLPPTLSHLIGTPPIDFLKSLFDFYIESAVVGMRKPDPAFFKHAMKVIGVERGGECVFLDDIGVNLKAARGLGMRGIRVYVGRAEEAVRELEEVVGMDLGLKPGAKL
ncbi:hypothetical protein HDV05_002793 [Chytridiales sp. JEL 0842]|nr:hypothetical protein HDV05_002793 [Chytridiales sp. JEL 0842]